MIRIRDIRALPFAFLAGFMLLSAAAYADEAGTAKQGGTTNDAQRAVSTLETLAVHLKEVHAAAYAGNGQAQYTLGVLYATGTGVEKDIPRAMRWLTAAGNRDIVLAQFRLGVLYATGEGIATNNAKAAYWFRKAALQGVPAAQHNLGTLLFNGRGLKQDKPGALRWFKRAAAQGNMTAALQVGLIYANGDEGIPQDDSSALRWLRRAAEQGEAHAQLALGQFYATGKGVSENPVEAYAWFDLAHKSEIEEASRLRNAIKEKLSKTNLRRARRKAWLLKERFKTISTSSDKNAGNLSSAQMIEADVRLLDSKRLFINGTFGAHTFEKTKKILKENPDVSIIMLNSPGGIITTGMLLAEMVEKRKLIALVNGQCSSACTLPLFASHYPSATSHSIIGFHKPVRPQNTVSDALVDDDIAWAEWVMRERYLWSGFPRDFVRLILSVPGDSIYFPTKAELTRFGLLKGVFEEKSRRFVDAPAWCRTYARLCTARVRLFMSPQAQNSRN